MKDYLNIGSTPADEPCAQVGSKDYRKMSIIECRAFAHQCHREMVKKFGEGYTVLIRIKSFPHDFGSYMEVVVEYTPGTNEEQAFYLESLDMPNWDQEALEELKEAGYTLHLENRL